MAACHTCLDIRVIARLTSQLQVRRWFPQLWLSACVLLLQKRHWDIVCSLNPCSSLYHPGYLLTGLIHLRYIVSSLLKVFTVALTVYKQQKRHLLLWQLLIFFNAVLTLKIWFKVEISWKACLGVYSYKYTVKVTLHQMQWKIYL